MAFLTMTLYSVELGRDTNLCALLPENKHGRHQAGRREYPVVYALHGYGDNHTSWMRKSTLELVARDYDVVVVMPEADNSFYTDRPGSRYHTYVSEELPQRMAAYLPISTRREDTFIMGNSMGGYGAFLMALSHPGRYAAAASLSGILGICYCGSSPLMGDPDFRVQMDLSFGGEDSFRTSPYNLYRLASELGQSGARQPRLLHLCGTEDDLALEWGRDFVSYVDGSTDLSLQYREIEGGAHGWGTWNPLIVDAFAFFGLSPRPSPVR